MLLAPTEDQRQIADAVNSMLAAEAPFDRWYLPQTDPLADEVRLLAFGAQMGWTGFAAPEAIGGSEATLIDEMLVFRELGARLVPVGLVAAAIGAHVALDAGEEALAARIVSGDAGVALMAGGMAVGAAGAELALKLDEGSITLIRLLVDSAPLVGIDGMTSCAAMPADRYGDEVARSSATLALRLRLLVAAQQQGVAETALAQSNAYAAMREQFGRAIGSFQAVRHRIADMEIRARCAQAQVYFAAVALHEGREDAPMQVISAAVLAGDAARNNAEANIAVHGAIGVTTENIGHLLLKRSLLWTFVAGSDSDLLDLLAEMDGPLL
jgi:alkylation response protein AidB-like acyl-CoA dehydrogenase